MAKRTQAENEDRRRYLRLLRDGLPGEPQPIAALTRVACEYGDQTIQKAAIGGLLKHGGAEAVLGVAARMLDSWGTGTLAYCVRTCRLLADDGGLIVLAATLFYDNRFITDKMEAIRAALRTSGDQASLGQLDELDDATELFREPKLVNKWVPVIQGVANRDVREGITLGSQFRGTVGWQGQVLTACLPSALTRAGEYVESRVPGLLELFDQKLSRTDSGRGHLR